MLALQNTRYADASDSLGHSSGVFAQKADPCTRSPALFSGFLYDTIRLFIHEEDLWYKNDGFDLGDYSNPAASTVMSRKGSVRTATSLTLLASTPPS